MRERDRLSLRAHREEVEAEERRQQEERERPFREAQAKFDQNLRSLHALYRERILNGRDDEMFISPELAGVRMSLEEAAEFNRKQAELFVQQTPDFEPFRSPEAFHAITGYFERHNIKIISAAMFKAAFERLRTFGIISPRPVPEQPTPEPEAIIESTPEPPKPETFVGRDPETGEERVYTSREVYLMGSEQYRRCFPVLPTMAHTIFAMREQRGRA
jgi:hypothetical protein